MSSYLSLHEKYDKSWHIATLLVVKKNDKAEAMFNINSVRIVFYLFDYFTLLNLVLFY